MRGRANYPRGLLSLNTGDAIEIRASEISVLTLRMDLKLDLLYVRAGSIG